MITNQLQKKPKLRFPEFGDEWAHKKLGKVAEFLKGKGISKNEVTVDGKYPCIKYGELYTQYNEIVKKIVSKTNVLPEDSFVGQKNDVIIPSSGETALDIATTSCVKNAGILFGGDINVIRFSKDQSGDFFAYYLTNFQRRNIAKLAQGQSVVHLYASQLKKLEVGVPSFPEQQKIASFLEFVDEWLNDLREEKEFLQKYKKGMMQNIFSQEIRFKDESGKSFPKWEDKKLNDIVYGKDKRTKVNNEFPILSSSMTGVYLQTDYFNKQTASQNNVGYKIIEKGDFVYRSMSDTGYFTFNLQNKVDVGIVSPAYPVFKNKEGIVPSFLFYALNNFDYIKRQILFIKEGGTRYAMSFPKFIKIKIKLPSFNEQQKIADFFVSLDKSIEVKQQQITLVDEWRKGLMQGLFI